MGSSLAAEITKVASKQTFYTIRLLVDGSRREAAYRAYAYFRWLDDVLDATSTPGARRSDHQGLDRLRFLDRQRNVLEQCLRGGTPPDLTRHEVMLADLARSADLADGGLRSYLRNMMLVMDFDGRRRGRLVSQRELDQYTRWLAIAVTDAMEYFLGEGSAPLHDDTRYAAVQGAHVVHMLRDTFADVEAGYYNIPREVLDAHSIGPGDIESAAYRAWVESRVQLARRLLETGRAYFARVHSLRHRLAGLAYIARFQWLIDTLERERFAVRSEYAERRAVATAWRMGWLVTRSILSSPAASTPAATRAEP